MNIFTVFEVRKTDLLLVTINVLFILAQDFMKYI